jgi:hypothetical protein
MNLAQSQAACGIDAETDGTVKQINPAAYITTTTSCSSNFNKKTTTTTDPDYLKQITAAEALSTLVFPPEFNASEQALARLYVQTLEPALRQHFLDETAAQIEAKRNTSNPIRNPIAYLGWLCNEQAKGNTRLTSLSIRYRDNRLRKRQTEQQIQQKQQELVASTPVKPRRQAHDNPARQLREALATRKKQP